jgi:hypothetical protein
MHRQETLTPHRVAIDSSKLKKTEPARDNTAKPTGVFDWNWASGDTWSPFIRTKYSNTDLQLTH